MDLSGRAFVYPIEIRTPARKQAKQIRTHTDRQ